MAAELPASRKQPRERAESRAPPKQRGTVGASMAINIKVHIPYVYNIYIYIYICLYIYIYV